MTGGNVPAETEFIRHIISRSKASAQEMRRNHQPVPRLNIEVVSRVHEDGRLTPLSLDWEGQALPVAQVLDCRPGSSRKHEENGLRYQVQVADLTIQLYYEANHWYLEYDAADPEVN